MYPAVSQLALQMALELTWKNSFSVVGLLASNLLVYMFFKGIEAQFGTWNNHGENNFSADLATAWRHKVGREYTGTRIFLPKGYARALTNLHQNSPLSEASGLCSHLEPEHLFQRTKYCCVQTLGTLNNHGVTKYRLVSEYKVDFTRNCQTTKNWPSTVNLRKMLTITRKTIKKRFKGPIFLTVNRRRWPPTVTLVLPMRLDPDAGKFKTIAYSVRGIL